MINKHKASILQVLPELNTGGVERGACDLAIYAKDKGLRIITVSNGGSMVEKLDQAGCEHICTNLKTKNPLKIYLNIFRLKKLCKKNNVKIIHARSRAPAWSAYYTARKLGVPFVTTFHGFYKNNFPFKKHYNAIMAKGDKIIAVSDFIREHIFETYDVEPKKVTVIHRGVDLDEFNPKHVTDEQIQHFKEEKFIPLNVPVILLPGRITRWKGHDVAIKAVAELSDKEFILAFAGKVDAGNNFAKELITLINDKGLEKKVKFLSDIKRMPVAYAASDLVLSASAEPETFGRVSAEANAMGKIVIASDHGGSREIIIDGRTGYLFKNKDYKELAKKIRYALELLADDATKHNFASDCRNNIIENFSLQKMCENTINLYNQLNKFDLL
jgi:glycosyltransferase involved in cell wall biosynthesis